MNKKTAPDVGREQVTLRLPAELLEQLRAEAERQGKSFNCLVINIFWKVVKQAS